VPEIDIDLDANEIVKFGESELRVIKTPGHTPGHIALFNEAKKVLFTGDTLFKESIGRTDLPGGDYSWIMKSILEEIVPLGDDVVIYPGHEDSSTIGHETLYNPFITEVLNNEINYKG
jgi:glyoxylase-like metal-dependent hydrolase (beta-lactamase superfamily II)